MTEQRLALHNTIGVFADASRAADALHTLEEEGIVPPAVSLLGPDRQMPPGATAPQRGRGAVLAGVGRHLGFGLVAGTTAGGVLGSVAWLLLDTLAIAPGTSWLAAGVVGAVMGQVAGSLIALEAAGRKASMWEQSLHPFVPRAARGATLVAVHTDDADTAARGAELLRRSGAEKVAELEATDRFESPWTRAATVGDRVPSDSPAAPGGSIGARGGPQAATQ